MSKKTTLTRLDSFHYTTTEGKVHPKGTLMWHYALDGEKEVLDSYEEAKGNNFSEVKDGEHKGKPIFFTSKNYCAVNSSVEVKLTKEGFVNPIKSIEELEQEQAILLAKKAKDNAPMSKRQLEFLAQAGKAGVTVAMPE